LTETCECGETKVRLSLQLLRTQSRGCAGLHRFDAEVEPIRESVGLESEGSSVIDDGKRKAESTYTYMPPYLACATARERESGLVCAASGEARNWTYVIPSPMLSCETDLLRELVVRAFAVGSTSEERENIIDVGVVDLDGNVAVERIFREPSIPRDKGESRGKLTGPKVECDLRTTRGRG